MIVTGKGSITQLDKTKTPYRCREWMLQVSTTEGRLTHRYKGSMSDAKLELTRFINNIENNKCAKATKFNKYSTYWLNYRTNSGIYSPNTIETDKKYVNKLNDVFAGFYLHDFTPQMVRDSFITIPQTKNPEKELSGTYKNHMFFTLKSILDMALYDELIEKNPCNLVKPPKKETSKRKYLSMSQLKKLLDSLDKEPLDGRIVFIYCLALLGIRRQEAIPLRWSDINWEQHTITINKALKYGDNTIGKTKSESGNRIIPIPVRLENILKKWKIECEKNLIESKEICCNSNGDRFDCKSNYAWWKDFKNRYGIEDVTFHELRHTNLSIMAKKIGLFELKQYAGWSDLAPAKFYIHINQDSMVNAVRSIDF